MSVPPKIQNCESEKTPAGVSRQGRDGAGSHGDAVGVVRYPSKPSMYFFALAIISSRVRAFMTSAPLRPIKESK